MSNERTAVRRSPARSMVDAMNSGNTAEPPTSEELSFADFFSGPDDLRRVEIPNHSKGGKPGVVFVQSIAAKHVIKRSSRKKDMPEDWAYELISLAVVDSNRNRIFDTPEKVQRLSELDLATFTLLQREVMIKNGMAKEEEITNGGGEDDGESKNDGTLS